MPAFLNTGFIKLTHQARAWIEPAAVVQGSDERRLARLAAGLSLIIGLAFIVRAIIFSPVRPVFVAFALLTVLSYGLSRTRYYHLGAWLAMLVLILPSYVITLSGGQPLDSSIIFARFAWQAIAIVIAGLMFSTQVAAFLAAINITSLLLLAGLLERLRLADTLNVISFLLVMTLTTILVAHQREQVEQERNQRELNRERRLNEVTYTISSAQDLPAILEHVVQQAVVLTNGEAGLLSLTDASGERMADVIGHNLPAEQISRRPPKGEGLAWKVIQTQRSLRLDNYQNHPQRLTRTATMPAAVPIQGYLGAPVMAGETCLGSLAVASTLAEHRFSASDQELLEMLARQAGVAIQTSRLLAALNDDLNERIQMQAALRQRDSILEAVAFAAGQFLQSQDWHLYIQTVLAELGGITRSSHAYIFQHHTGKDGSMVTTQLYQWPAPDSASTLGRPEFSNVPLQGRGLERWRSAMLRGEPFYGSRSTFLPGEAEYLAPLGAQSILEMPIYLRREFSSAANTGEKDLRMEMDWWGLIGFDDYRSEREWSTAEVDAIRIAAGILSAAIQRQSADQAMRQREDIYRRAISSADAVPYYQEYQPNRFSFMGDGIFALTGYHAAEMTPDLWNACVEQAIMLGESADMDEKEATILAHTGKLTSWRCDYHVRQRSGELRWIADSAIQLFSSEGQASGCIGIMQDITYRKAVEEAALQANLELEKRVQQRTGELQSANREMEAFAYSVSHDLRAPLRAIDGYSRILQENYTNRLDVDGQQCLANVRLATHKMEQLIEDLLKLSRVTRSEMKAETVDLSEMALDLLYAHLEQEPLRKLHFDVQNDLWVQGDANLLRVAMSNLIDNAWKFTRHTPAPQIHLGAVQQARRRVYFVRDNGAGFDMRYANRLFQPFQRLHSGGEFEGTGVGLATVNRIIQRHNGRIWAESQPGEGACFYFTLEETLDSPAD